MGQPICVDIDNIIARTDEVMRKVIKRHSKTSVDLRYEDIITFNYWECIDQQGRCLERSEWDHIHMEFTRNHLRAIIPYPNVRVYLSRLAERFEVHLATSRLSEGQQITRDWLQAHNLPYSELHFVGHRKKHEIPKTFVAAIEDDREQAELFLEGGVQVFLLAHPWNVTETSNRLSRVQGWEGLVEKVLDVAR